MDHGKVINQLIPDIYLLLERKDGWFNGSVASDLSTDIARRLSAQLGQKDTKRATLRLSAMGPRCPCALWHSINRPETAEALPPWAIFKYSFGHVIEALALTLAKEAGHEVTGEQDELVVDGIVGHRDAVIDGCIVDVKSCSSRMFDKFKSGALAQSDDFGYLDQLDGYVVGSATDELVRCKDRGYILAIDKTLGRMVLYEHRTREARIRSTITNSKDIVARNTPPACTCGTVADGQSGNYRLDTKASYSAYRHSCFPELRTFLYADGPRYLTKVMRKPDVPEIDHRGNILSY